MYTTFLLARPLKSISIISDYPPIWTPCKQNQQLELHKFESHRYFTTALTDRSICLAELRVKIW